VACWRGGAIPLLRSKLSVALASSGAAAAAAEPRGWLQLVRGAVQPFLQRGNALWHWQAPCSLWRWQKADLVARCADACAVENIQQPHLTALVGKCILALAGGEC